jgi:8-amino-7-oxononanoate synthase
MAAELQGIRDAQRWRETLAFDALGNNLLSFASNDYLGLSAHPRVREAAIDAVTRFGTGATASRLVVGTRSVHLQLEAELAEWQQAERALVFPTGYAANIGVLSVFGTEDVTLFSDELNHASIIDGCRLAKARTVIYPHGDCEHLKFLLETTPGRKLVVSDVVFSMDGEVAPVPARASACAQHDALLVLDEAHAVLQPIAPITNCSTLRVGTLSKTLGAQGGWVSGSRAMIELLVNRARSFIFTTALSPPDTAAALAALRICRSAEGVALRSSLRRLIDLLRPRHPSPIIPIVLHTDSAALEASAQLFRQGFHVPAIRPPSVPVGTARLRVALSATHDTNQVMALRAALATLSPQAASVA